MGLRGHRRSFTGGGRSRTGGTKAQCLVAPGLRSAGTATVLATVRVAQTRLSQGPFMVLDFAALTFGRECTVCQLLNGGSWHIVPVQPQAGGKVAAEPAEGFFEQIQSASGQVGDDPLTAQRF